MREKVPNRLEERWVGHALVCRDESDNFDGKRSGCHCLMCRRRGKAKNCVGGSRGCSVFEYRWEQRRGDEWGKRKPEQFESASDERPFAVIIVWKLVPIIAG